MLVVWHFSALQTLALLAAPAVRECAEAWVTQLMTMIKMTTAATAVAQEVDMPAELEADAIAMALAEVAPVATVATVAAVAAVDTVAAAKAALEEAVVSASSRMSILALTAVVMMAASANAEWGII